MPSAKNRAAGARAAIAVGACLLVGNAGAESGFMPYPVDLEWAANVIHAGCAAKAPALRPSYIQTFHAWRLRIGTAFGPYQQWLYDSAVEDYPEAERPARLRELKARYENYYRDGLKNLESMDEGAALEACRELAKQWNDRRLDAEIIRRFTPKR